MIDVASGWSDAKGNIETLQQLKLDYTLQIASCS